MAIATKSTLCYYVDMTQFVVNLTAKEYGEGQRKKAAKLRNAVIAGSIALIGMCYGIWYFMNQMVYN